MLKILGLGSIHRYKGLIHQFVDVLDGVGNFNDFQKLQSGFTCAIENIEMSLNNN